METKNTVQKYKLAIERFITEKGHEPTALDFDSTDYLPSARTIQRKYGGLPKFRSQLGLNTMDFTKGSVRAKKAKQSMDDCLIDETELYKLLVKKYGVKNVSTPARIFANCGMTADFRLDIGNTIYLIDVFKPNSTHSFKGCVAIKNKKYLKDEESMYTGYNIEFIYVCVNEDVMVPIKNKIPVMSLSSFKAKFTLE